MKKLISFFIISVLLFAAVACAGSASNNAASSVRGELTVAYDNAITGELLPYFQANQACTAAGVLLDAQTDYAKLSETVAVALLKDEAIAEKLKAAGWIETEDWTEAQKKANEEMFGFIVLTPANQNATQKTASKLLMNWLVGDGSYERTITTVSGGCGCSRTETKVTVTSDAPELVKSEQFKALVNP